MHKPLSEAESALEITMRNKGTVMLIGEVDSGKSFLARQLVTQAIARGIGVALLDCDIGQSTVGPPATVGLSIPKDESNIYFPHSLYFVGSVSPRGHVPQLLAGAKRLLEKAKEKAELVVIDTTGTIMGDFGLFLKLQKIKLLQPDLLIALFKSNELDHILSVTSKLTSFETLKLRTSEKVRPKSPTERYENRKRRFAEYFAPSREVRIPRSGVELIWRQGILNPQGLLCGLLDSQLELLCLAILKSIDEEFIIVRLPVATSDIANAAVIEIGSIKLTETGDHQF